MIRLYFTMMRSRIVLACAAVRGVSLPVLAVFAAMLAGCQAGEQNYLTNGIGSELTAPNLVRTETLQNQYFSYLCRQATSQSYAPNTACAFNDWDLIVKQGMNDIDRRCDAYLQWLDNRKRSKGPWISQISDTAAATGVVLSQVDVGTNAITIVAQAFQLITRSVENYHSRLLLEIESSTIHSIVLKGRYDFRTYLQEKRIHFSNKPDVEHALRSYTRLCLPFAIEAKINNFSTLGANNERPGADNTLGDLPVVGDVPKPDVSINVGQGTGGLPPTTPDISKFFGVQNFTEARLNTFQRATCTPTAAAVGPRTKAAIAIVEQTLEMNKQAVTVNGFLDDSEYRNVVESQCSQKFTNYFEKITLAGGKVEEVKYFNAFVAPAYKKVFNTEPPVDGEPELSKFRGVIAELRGALVPNDALPKDFRGDVSTWITPRLHAAMEAKVLE
ncbi:hypothetical protein ELH21_09370 [Rhizobium leguminosarum]|uniref:hypothetical protein n=1 Tax=Rhizobium leguminosarum TaxID=384 RepID=UPI0010301698|nr:hypothetical protein [Rhizobium leguminosarum]TBD04588.1 hypothetical protein ELH21_09370 [Rhizobium leguminosarum]